MMVLPQQSPPASIALLLIEVDSQDEFIGELVDGFYKSLKRCLPMIFKSTHTSFASCRVIFFRAIEYIRDVGGDAKAEFLKEMVNNLERDIDEWNNLRQLDLTPLVEAKLERLAEQMKKNYLETSQEIEAVSQELNSLEAREDEVAEAMAVSSEALDFAKSQIKKAWEMLQRPTFFSPKLNWRVKMKLFD